MYFFFFFWINNIASVYFDNWFARSYKYTWKSWCIWAEHYFILRYRFIPKLCVLHMRKCCTTKSCTISLFSFAIDGEFIFLSCIKCLLFVYVFNLTGFKHTKHICSCWFSHWANIFTWITFIHQNTQMNVISFGSKQTTGIYGIQFSQLLCFLAIEHNYFCLCICKTASNCVCSKFLHWSS